METHITKAECIDLSNRIYTKVSDKAKEILGASKAEWIELKNPNHRVAFTMYYENDKPDVLRIFTPHKRVHLKMNYVEDQFIVGFLQDLDFGVSSDWQDNNRVASAYEIAEKIVELADNLVESRRFEIKKEENKIDKTQPLVL